MSQKTYSASTDITIKAPLERVWSALTEPAEIKKYLHDTETKTDWVVGHDITWSGVWEGKPYVDKGKVIAYEPMNKLATSHWSPLAGTPDLPENYHIVTYELSSAGDETALKLTQSNSPSQESVDSMIKNGWEPILKTIKQNLESASLL